MPRGRLFIEWLAILAATLALGWWTLAMGTTGRFDMALLDRVATWGASEPSDDIILVTIDDRSLREVGQWPWDRTRIAELTDHVTAARARLVELDILFPEPSTPEADAALAASIARSGKIVLPFGFTPAEGRSVGVDPVMPLAPLADASAAMGHVALVPDADGSIRRAALTLELEAGPREQLQVAAQRLLGRGAPVALDASGAMPIMQLRPAGSFRSVPASAVLRGEVPARFFEDRIVLVGASAEGLGDIHPVPFTAGSLMPGVELQANLLQDLIEGSLIREASFGWSLLFGWLPVFVLFAGFWRLRPAACLVLASVMLVTLPIIAGLVVHASGIWIAPGPGLLAIIVAYPLWGWRRLASLSDYLLAKSDCLSQATALQPGKADGFDAIAREVDKLDFLVDEVGARRDFLRRIIETAPDAICAFDAVGGLLLLNGHARALFPLALVGEDFAAILAAGGAAPTERAEEFVFPDGRLFASTRSSETPQRRWQAISLVTLADVTAQRRAERERREMLEFLSHDMRSPQVAILNLASRPDDPGAFSRIRDHARRTMQLADNFVQLARLAEVPLVLEDMDLGALATEAIDRAWALAGARKIAIQAKLPEEPLFVHCDGQVMSRVLDNLIGNAVKYGLDGGRVEVTVSRSAGGAELCVTDNGPGLPPERLANPFQRFGPRDKSSSGSGLGLGFVAEALSRHGAEVSVESAPGQGTRFRISLAALPDL